MADIFEIFGKIAINGVDKAKQDLNEVTDAGEKSHSKLSKIGSAMGTIGKGLLIGTAAVATAGVGLVKQVSGAYGQLQQSIGGVETLFKDSAQTVIDNANKAYTTAGMSANDYMQNVTNFSASLLQGLGGDTVKAAEYADMAIRDMADNANKFGTDMERITDAYQGFSKQNYTMLDNLKLGYGGTQAEMYRLMSDAKKLDSTFDAVFSIDNKGHLEAEFSDMVKAINIVQREMGITGTTALEAGETIEGSFNSLGAAWENFLAGLGNPSADMKTIIDALANSIDGAIRNVVPVVENMVQALPTVVSALVGAVKDLLPSLISTFTELIKEVISAIVDLLPTAIPLILDCLLTVADALLDELPALIDAIILLITETLSKLSETIPTLIPNIVDGVMQAANAIMENAPAILDAVLEIIIQVGQALLESLPTIIDGLSGLIGHVVDFILEAVPDIIDAAITLFMGIVDALPDIIDAIIDALPTVISAITNALHTHLPTIIQGAIRLVTALARALPQIIQAIVRALPQIISLILHVVLDNLPLIIDAAIQLISGLVSALPQICAGLIKAIPDIFKGIWDSICTVFDSEFLGGIFSDAWDAVCTAWDNAQPYFDAAWTGIKSVLGEVDEWCGGIFSDAWDIACEAWDNAQPYFDGVWLSIKTVFGDTGEWLGEKFEFAWDTACEAWDNAQPYFDGIWASIKLTLSPVADWFGEKFGAAWENVCENWDKAKGYFSEKWTEIKTVFSTANTWFGEKFTAAKNAVIIAWSTIVIHFTGIKNGIVNTFDDVRSKLAEPFEAAKRTISGIADRIKNLFDFTITMPHIPLPHFSVSPPGWSMGDLLEGSIPSIGIDWYAKAMNKPMVMNRPTIFGYNSSTGQLLGGGEAGSEVVSGTSTLMSMISSAVSTQNNELLYRVDTLADSLERLIGLVGDYLPEIAKGVDREIVLDSSAMAVGMSSKIDRELGKIKLAKGRGNV